MPGYHALRTDRYDYVEYPATPAHASKETELYDLDADPTELTNIYNSAPHTLRSELKARLEE